MADFPPVSGLELPGSERDPQPQAHRSRPGRRRQLAICAGQRLNPTPDATGPSYSGMRESKDVALLDLTGASGPDVLDGVTHISNVAAILVPESLLGKLLAIPMQHVAATVPIPDGKKVKVMSGQIVLSGEALSANP